MIKIVEIGEYAIAFFQDFSILNSKLKAKNQIELGKLNELYDQAFTALNKIKDRKYEICMPNNVLYTYDLNINKITYHNPFFDDEQ